MKHNCHQGINCYYVKAPKKSRYRWVCIHCKCGIIPKKQVGQKFGGE